MRTAEEVKKMEEATRIFGKYVCLDIVEFTKRDEDAQLRIRGELDVIVKSCVEEHPILQDENRRVYVPTGDGMCIALLDTLLTIDSAELALPADIHLRVAIGIIKTISRRNSKIGHRRLQFEVRIGIHTDADFRITDINRHQNIAGAGINKAFRIMSLADGGQILASENVFNDLVRDRKDQFYRFDAKVRHDVPLVVYQFIEEGEGLIQDVPKAIEEQLRAKQTFESIIGPAVGLGLSKVYAFRNDTAVQDLKEDIRGASKRVWLLGVALHDSFDITDPEVIQLLNRKIDEGVKVRILLLDGFRSPAIFRALLESYPKESSIIVRASRKVPDPKDPYLAHRVFENFETACNELAENLNPKADVRFYGHTPSCWLAIVDNNKVYYQPYTFGDISANPKAGYQMPVIKLQDRTTPFRILEDHYNKLWATSDTDLFQTKTRLKAKAETLWRTFQKRKQDDSMWFEQIHGVLHYEKSHYEKSRGHDRRKYTRLPCLTLRLEAFIKWRGGKVTKGKVINFSYEGALLGLELAEDDERFTSLPANHEQSNRDIIARLDIKPEGGWKALKAELKRAAETERKRATPEQKPKPRGLSQLEAVKYAVDGLLNPNKKFKYIRKESPKSERERPRVALQARGEKRPLT